MSEDETDRRRNMPPSDDGMLSGKSSPALLSLKEPSIRMLKERFSETFAITRGKNGNQIHLFIIKAGMWALVWTFTPREFSDSGDISAEFGLGPVLVLIEDALSGRNERMLQKIDRAVHNALERISAKIDEFNLPR
jgi:hypothetical protein